MILRNSKIRQVISWHDPIIVNPNNSHILYTKKTEQTEPLLMSCCICMKSVYLVTPHPNTMMNLCLRQQICIGLRPTHLLKNTEHILKFSPVTNNGNQLRILNISLSITPLVIIKNLVATESVKREARLDCLIDMPKSSPQY